MMNYSEAARRHFNDAQLLDQSQRIPNADQFYGYATECALLALLGCLPQGAALFGPDGAVEEGCRKHVNFLWKKFRYFAENRKGRVLLDRLGFLKNPFHDWHTDHRYYSDSAALAAANIESHRSAAQKCMEVLDQTERETKPKPQVETERKK